MAAHLMVCAIFSQCRSIEFDAYQLGGRRFLYMVQIPDGGNVTVIYPMAVPMPESPAKILATSDPELLKLKKRRNEEAG